MRADLILFNARVSGCSSPQPLMQEVAMGGGRVLRVGPSLRKDRELARGAHVVNCRGGTLLPGFVDAHLHFFSFVDSLLSMDLQPHTGIRAISDIQAAVAKTVDVTSPGEWIRAKGYNEFYLNERRHPTRWDLDGVAPNHPVCLTHRSLHAHVLNTLALKRVGIDRSTPDPPGGLIDRDLHTGEPTGLLYEMGDVLAQRVPRWSDAAFERGVQRAGQELAASGITAFLDASPTRDLSRRKLFEAYHAQALVRQRISMMVGHGVLPELAQRDLVSESRQVVPVWGIKVILDRTSGALRLPLAQLTEIIQRAHDCGWPVAIHAVEEETIVAAVTAFESVLRAAGNSSNPGHRIEHGSLCPSPLARRIAALGVAVTTQPSFIYHHGERYLATVPLQQQPYLYPLATWLRSGVAVAGSSDCPLVRPWPLLGLYAAVTRRAENGTVLRPEERISAEEAVKLYTTSAAHAARLTAGAIAAGGVADAVVLSHDPLSVPPDLLKDIEVLLTIIEGKIVWSAGQL